MKVSETAALWLAAIIASSDDAIVSTTVDGTIETWNPSAERIFGYPAAEAIGQSADLIVPPARRLEEAALLDRIVRGRSIAHFDTTAVTRSGSALPISVSMSPVLSPDGELIGVTRIARDISEQRRLERQALQLAALVDSSEDAIVSKDLDGIVQTWNSAAERMFGYSAVEMVGHSITRIIPHDRMAEEADVLARVRAGRSVEHFETVRQRKDGSFIAISLSVSPIKSPGGAIVGASKIARDISHQRALERQAFRLAAIVDSAEDAIVSKDLNGTVQTWNRAAERMFGYTAAEMIGRSITAIIPPDRLHEEDRVLASIRAGKSIEHFETVRQRKDGSAIAISVSVSPIRTDAGTVIGASKIARDITQQKALEREAVRLAAIVDSSEDAIVSKDLEGVVQTWNRAAERMFGYSADEIIGRPITLIIPKDRWPEEEEVLTRVRGGVGIVHMETMRQRKDGTQIEVSLSVSPVATPDGRVIGASTIIRDVTLQRQLTRAAEEANRVKDEFLAMLSHELRTPLNAVLGYTRMLRVAALDAGGQARAIEVIERNANLLSQLVSDVLDVSGIVTGKVKLKPVACDLVDVLHAALDSVGPSADAKNISVRVRREGHAPLTCDADRMQQVFWNLLSNAVKFTPSGGEVTVRLTVSGDEAQVTVTDTGIGIRPDMLPFVFQRFWQGETGNSRTTGGLGLGLALVRHFVELHGGTVGAASDGEGQGATFTVTLPLTGGDEPSRPIRVRAGPEADPD